MVCDDIIAFLFNDFQKANACFEIFKHRHKKIISVYNYSSSGDCISFVYWLAGGALKLFGICYFIFAQQTTIMTYNVQIRVMLLKDLLDPQGKAVQAGLKNLGFNGVNDVRIGKHITLQIDANSEGEAKQLADDACKKLLANPVMEFYEIEMVN